MKNTDGLTQAEIRLAEHLTLISKTATKARGLIGNKGRMRVARRVKDSE